MTDKLFEDINYYQDKSLTYKKERITVRPENKAINNAINQGLMSNPADYRYLYTKCFKPNNIWYDIFLNLNTNYEESVRVEIWAEEIREEEE